MKRKLLLLGMAATLAGGANAAIVDGVRQAPVPKLSTLEFGTTMYMYNVGAGKFYLGTNDWETRSSIGDKGMKVKIVKAEEGLVGWNENTVELRDSVEKFSEWRNTFIADSIAAWVDNSTSTNRFFEISAGAQAGQHRFTGAPQNETFTKEKYPNCYFGWDPANPADTRITALLDITRQPEGCVDWAFVSESDYAVYLNDIDIYNQAVLLKGALDEAKAKGIDVAAEQAVYLNEASTIEEIQAALTAVKVKLADYEEQNVQADSPLDKTSLIVNPSFDNNNADGWSYTTKPAFQSWTDAEYYEKKFNFYQDLKNIPNGVYAMGLQAFYRAGWSDVSKKNFENGTGQLANIYTIVGTDSLSSKIKNAFADAIEEPLGMNESTVDGLSIPNNMETAEAYFNNGKYQNMVFFGTDSKEARIGLSKDSILGGDWVLFDNFTLKYYGNTPAAYQLWLDDVKKNTPTFADLPEGTLITKGTLDAFNSTLASVATAGTYAEVTAAMVTINNAVADVEANIEAWAKYKAAFEKAQQLAADAALEGAKKDDLADYVEFDGADFLADLTATTDEVIAETEALTTLIDEVVRTCITPGADVTDKYLVNPSFEKDNEGWTVKKADGGNVAYGGEKGSRCFEAWNNSDFDVYQVVKNAPLGVYEISVQGFYRYGRDANAYNAYKDGTAPNDAVYIYVNNNKATFKSVFDEKVPNETLYDNSMSYNNPYVDEDGEYWYTNDMKNTSIAFDNGMYKNTSFGIVVNEGDALRIGVMGNTSQLGDSWSIWDNFKMVYQGFKIDIIKPRLEETITRAEALVSNEQPMAKSAMETLKKSIADGKAALSYTDGKEMFQALADILAAQESVDASVELFKVLTAKNEELYEAIAVSTSPSVNEATALWGEISDGIGNGTLENEDAESYINKIAEMIVRLKLPDFSGATQDNPADFTAVIVNPNFDKDGANSVEGWQGTTGYNFGNDDTQKSALCLEFYNKKFNMSQSFIGLPKGAYEIGVQAFYRFGSTAEDAEKYFADANTEGNAYIYGASSAAADIVKAPVNLLASGAIADKDGIDGTVSEIKNGSESLYVPNDMVSANSFFLQGAYINTVRVNVTEDGKLTIGIAKDENVGNDWVIMDSWTLKYLGSTFIDGINNVNGSNMPQGVQYFNMNGVQTKSLQKGINIMKVTDAAGKVTVKKVIVK